MRWRAVLRPAARLEPQLMQPRVQPLARHQFGVRALLGDAALLHDDDAVGVFDGGQAVRDHQRGPVRHQVVERVLHQAFGFVVERGGGLVEDEYGRVLQQRAGDLIAQRLGNFAEELQTIQSRFTFLDLQSADLENAVMTLENAIHQIDGETRERLQETFDRVNLLFHELFTSVFGGGNAKLTLSGEEILDATIQLIAQPPGKKNNSIHLLSGGEKALTALTLIFSLFQLNPAPFCLLDEVDAPLDDINAIRFSELVKRMANETQFLFQSDNAL